MARNTDTTKHDEELHAARFSALEEGTIRSEAMSKLPIQGEQGPDSESDDSDSDAESASGASGAHGRARKKQGRSGGKAGLITLIVLLGSAASLVAYKHFRDMQNLQAEAAAETAKMANSIDVPGTEKIVGDLLSAPDVVCALALEGDVSGTDDAAETEAAADRAIDEALTAVQEANPGISKEELDAGIDKAEKALESMQEEEQQAAQKKPHSTLRVLAKDFIRRMAVVAGILSVLAIPQVHKPLTHAGAIAGMWLFGPDNKGITVLIPDYVKAVLLLPLELGWLGYMHTFAGPDPPTLKTQEHWVTRPGDWFGDFETKMVVVEDPYKWFKPANAADATWLIIRNSAITAASGIVLHKFLDLCAKGTKSSLWGRADDLTKYQEKSETSSLWRYNPLVLLTRPIDWMWRVPRGGEARTAEAVKPTKPVSPGELV